MRALFFEQSHQGKKRVAPAAAYTSFLIAFSFLCLLVFASFAALDYDWNWASVWKYREKLAIGWLTTVWISLASLFLSGLLGGISALVSRSAFLPLRYVSKIYVEMVRGTPLLVQTLIVFYVFADSIHLENRYVVGILILSLFSGAYVSEIFRAGVESIGKSQLISAQSIGFTPAQTFRYVVFPQALQRSLPALAGQFANLIKDSSLLSIIAISEFTLNAQEVNSFSLSSFESYFPLALGYLILTLPIFHFSRYLERRLSFDT